MASKKLFNYVSLGDSIAAGHTIDTSWDSNYGERSQFSCNGRTTPTTLVPGCYTYLINEELKNIYGAGNVNTTSFARSGATVESLMRTIDDATYGPIMRNALAQAHLVTISIGANDILQPALLSLNDYVATGDLSGLTAIVNNNLTNLGTDGHTYSYIKLFDKLRSINPNAKYIFTTIYNPYKYLYVDPNQDGFFQPLLDLIPPLIYEVDLGFTKVPIDLAPLVREAILNTDILKTLFSRVNTLPSWVNTRVDDLDTVIRNKINTYRNNYPNFYVADTKVLFDKIPDRGDNSAQVYYNDLISVEYTRNYDIADMNWGALWNHGNAFNYWWNLATKHLYWHNALPSTNVWDYVSFDYNAFAGELGENVVTRVIQPDVDPHPEYEGHKLLKFSFNNVYGLIKYDVDKYHNIGDVALANTKLYSTAAGFDASMWCTDSGRVTPLDITRTDYTNYKNPSNFTLGELVSGPSIRTIQPKITTIYYKEDKSRGLRVWLPLINNHINQGLSDLKFTANVSTAKADGGKLNNTAYSNSSATQGGLLSNKILDIPEATLSMFAWIKPTSDSVNPMGIGGMHTINTISSSYDAGTGMSFQIISKNGKRVIAVSTGDGTSRTWDVYSGNINLTLNTWYHVGFTYDGATIKIYVDGNLDAEYMYTNQKNIHDYVYVFGWSRDGTKNTPEIFTSNYKFIGQICDFRIYDSVLGIREVKELSKGLALHYKFDGESGNLVLNSRFDRSGTGYLTTAYTYDRQGLGRYLNPGEKCTLTVCFTPPANFGCWYPHINQGNWGGWMPRMYSDGTTSRQIVSGVSLDGWVYYQDPNTTPSMADICMYWRDKNDNAGSGNVTIHWLRLDLGDKSHNYWSPAISEAPGLYLTEDDCSGYGNNATKSKIMPSMSDTGRYSSSALFNQANIINKTCNTTGWTDFTMAAWVNPSAFDSERSCILIGGMYLTIDNAGRVSTYCYGKSNEGYHTTSEGVPLNTWSHIAAVWNNKTGTVKMFINGVLKKTVTGVTGQAAGSLASQKEIGTEGSGRPFHGKLSDLRLYATALSDEDIAELYNTPAILTKNGTFMAAELVENNELQGIKKTGVVNSSNYSATTALISDMKIKAMPDGTSWARINSLDLRANKTLFQNANEVNYCSTNNRYSNMRLVDKFKQADGTYEFMLTYPSRRRYTPAGYTTLECIESTGAQWIDTGVTGNARWEIDIEFNKSNDRQLMGYNGGGNNYWGINKYRQYECGLVMEYEHSKRENVVYCFNEGNIRSLYVNHNDLPFDDLDVSSAQFRLLGLPGYNTQFACFAKLYRCKCYKGGALIRDFIPVRRNVDSEVGLYDLVNNRFYGNNSGIGVLFAHEIEKYIPIEYIESNGTQYIDTGFSAPSGFKFDLAFSYNTVQGSYIIGSHNSAAPYGRNGVGSVATGSWELGTGDACPQAGSITVGQKYRLQGSTIKGNSYLDVNGARTITTSDSTSRSSYNLYVFWEQYGQTNGGSPVNGKLYYLKLYDANNVLVRDFIPAISAMNGAVGLYDLLNNKFYPSSNVNAFFPGGVPEDKDSPYEFLEYIASSTGSGQYINTGVNPNNNTAIHIKAMPIDGTSIFGSNQGGNNFNLTSSGDKVYTYFYWGNSGVGNKKTNHMNQVHYWSLNNAGAKVDNKLLNSYSNYSWSNSIPILLFARYSDGKVGDAGACRIYECDIYDNQTLIRSFHPVRRKSDGVIGMYESVHNSFYTNAGSGVFTPGPAIIHKTPIEYYNRWIQTSSPNVNATTTGYKPISMSWTQQFKTGIMKYSTPTTTIYSCDTPGGNWYAPIGQVAIWEGGIPAADGTMELATELWVRFDRHSNVNSLSIQNYGSMGMREFLEI